MATKIPEAYNRLVKRIFVCQRCLTKARADSDKILKGKVKCRKCNGTSFRPLKKK